jgi:hypothetical protein
MSNKRFEIIMDLLSEPGFEFSNDPAEREFYSKRYSKLSGKDKRGLEEVKRTIPIHEIFDKVEYYAARVCSGETQILQFALVIDGYNHDPKWLIQQAWNNRLDVMFHENSDVKFALVLKGYDDDFERLIEEIELADMQIVFKGISEEKSLTMR